MAKQIVIMKVLDQTTAMKKSILSIVGAGFCLATFTMVAVVATPIEAQAQNRAFVAIEKQRNLPVRGQSQVKVRNAFGEPASKTPAVGQPPISRWNYPGFIVYFEYSHVITTVAEQDSLPVSLGNIQ